MCQSQILKLLTKSLQVSCHNASMGVCQASVRTREVCRRHQGSYRGKQSICQQGSLLGNLQERARLVSHPTDHQCYITGQFEKASSHRRPAIWAMPSVDSKDTEEDEEWEIFLGAAEDGGF
ncbi:hypothetical protein KUCAC02_012109 [Chaenocephalus aceratus]|uniref:Uncharacterized protein n=1 Tax=Chaenocephalus aceratus TaxID=36190 RepID=A0ACB9XBD3_CHAAC|nr:hypothetical protein KUCAC02_012109 [Chaenocephalus aceratus]